MLSGRCGLNTCSIFLLKPQNKTQIRFCQIFSKPLKQVIENGKQGKLKCNLTSDPNFEQALKTNDIRSAFNTVLESKKNSPISRESYCVLFKIVRFQCTFDPNAKQYLDIILKKMEKDKVIIDNKLVDYITKAYSTSK